LSEFISKDFELKQFVRIKHGGIVLYLASKLINHNLTVSKPLEGV